MLFKYFPYYIIIYLHIQIKYNNFSVIKNYKEERTMQAIGSAFDFVDENSIIIGTGDGTVFLYDYRENKDKRLLPHTREVCKVKYCNSLNFVITGGNDNKVNIFDLRAWKQIKELNHLAAVKAIDVDKSKLVTGAGKYTNTYFS